MAARKTAFGRGFRTSATAFARACLDHTRLGAAMALTGGTGDSFLCLVRDIHRILHSFGQFEFEAFLHPLLIRCQDFPFLPGLHRQTLDHQ